MQFIEVGFPFVNIIIGVGRNLDENLLLDVDFMVPATFRGKTIADRQKIQSIPDPTPNVYACSTDYKICCKEIREYWKSKNAANSFLDAWNTMSLAEKFVYQNTNIPILIVEQTSLFNLLVPDNMKIEIPLLDSDNDVQMEPVLDYSELVHELNSGRRRSRSQSMSSLGAASTITASTTTASTTTATRSTITRIEPHVSAFECDIREYFEEIGTNQNPQFRGLFSSNETISSQQPTKKLKSDENKHIATKTTLEKLMVVLKSSASFMDESLSKADGTGELNDVIIIHSQTIDFTKSFKHGDRKQYHLPRDATNVNIVGRSERMIQRFLNLAARGQLEERTIAGNPINLRLIHPTDTTGTVLSVVKAYDKEVKVSRSRSA